MRNNHFKLFATCIPVKGARRSMIYDLERNSYRFIPNALYGILQKYDGQTIDDVKKAYKGDEETIQEYFDFLIEHEYIFFCEECELENFPSLNYNWDYPGYLSNAVIEFTSCEKLDFNTLFKELSDLGCRHLILIFKVKRSIDYLQTIFERIRAYTFKSVELYLISTDELNDLASLRSLCDEHLNISKLMVYQSDKNEKHLSRNGLMGMITYTSVESIELARVDKSSFRVNMNLFMESQQHNSFFNRMIIISTEGYFYNSFFDRELKWSTDQYSLPDLVIDKEFASKWFASKDRTKVCRDCEFRYACVDSREPVYDNTKKMWTHSSKCNYDPYSSTWSQ